MSEAEADVLVIGLGPAGGSAAAVGARLGLRVLAIDRKKEIGRPVQCAEFIPMPLSRYTQSGHVLVQGILGMKTALPSGAVEVSPLSGLMIDRAAFDSHLAGAAQAAGALIHTDSRLEMLRPVGREAVVATPHGPLTVRYRVLVAADGPNSMVARLAGLPRMRTVNTRQYTVPLLDGFADTDIWLSPRYPGGYAWLFPKGNMANLGVGIDPGLCRDMKSPLNALHAQLVSAGRVGRQIVYRTGGAIPVGGMRKRLVEGRIVFAGDAAGLTHPVTGAGIAAAVASGERAGEAAHALLSRGDPNALSEYEEDIRDQFSETLSRALIRRSELASIWNSPRAASDAAHRRGWIAFSEYFATEDPCRTAA